MINDSIPQIILTSPGQIAFSIGDWPVRWYGVFIALAFFSAYMLAEKIVLKSKLDLEVFNDTIFYVLISSIVFARLWFIFLSFDYYKDHIDEIPKIWLGGQSIHGGILGGVLAVLIYSKIKNIPFYKYIDVLSIVFPMGQAIGRWGNFFNNEAFGRPVNNALIKLYIPEDFRPMQYIDFKYFHPTFLYESFLDFMIFVFLLKKYDSWSNKPGKVFWLYLLLYSSIRFVLEFIRVDSLYLFGHLPSAQVISVIVIIISLLNLKKLKA